MASTMQLEFSQAMSDFKTMFPDMDREVIEAVLRANQGAVDATIDQLLAMSTDNQNEKLRNELDATNTSPQRSLINLNDTERNAARRGSGVNTQPTAQLIDITDGSGITRTPANNTNTAAAAAANAVLLNLSSSGAAASSNHTGASPKLRPPAATAATTNKLSISNTGTPSKRSNATRRWNPPMLGPLPPGFLRIAPSASHDATRDFELPDEQFAMMLQNEEFMNQLRWNQEFMNALEKEQCGKAKTEDDAAFKERLKHMGKVSRKKFLQMARVFTWQRNKKATTAKQIDSLPLKEEPSDDEMNHVPPEKDAVIQKAEDQRNPPQSPVNGGDNEDVAASPPSVVMTIKRGPAAVPPVITTKSNANANNKAQATSKSNSTNSSPPADPSQGIPTKDIYENGHMNEEKNIEKICPNDGVDLKLLIIITSAQAHAEARLAIRQTWGHYGMRRDVSTAFILGRSTNGILNVALTQENFIYGDLIRGHFIDSYNNLTLKTISALEWVDVHCTRAKYVLKTDDDMFINVPKLLAFLNSHNKEKRVIYGRLVEKWKPHRNKKSKYYVSVGQFGAPVLPPFCTGGAYVMSNDIIHDLYVRSLNQIYVNLEDVFITGIVANQLGIKRVNVTEFPNTRIILDACFIRETISVHMIKANEQFDMWQELLDQTIKC